MSPRWINDPEKAAAEAAQRAAVPDATQAAKAAEVAVDTAAEAATGVSPAVEHAAERVQDAAETLVDELEDTATDLKSKSRARLCPYCKGELEPYHGDNPHKQGTSWCPGCSTRWAAGLRAPAPGSVAPAGWKA
jgi:hypothetical protein